VSHPVFIRKKPQNTASVLSITFLKTTTNTIYQQQHNMLSAAST